ncbi:hypothetical protein VTN00DRAFT_1744 [Thermoascus crustaceus]|uniref:uncharacterized protein n=1 Tax=Thermoascus crustaceus TaxID=5088 RepID=UPI00374210A7
MTMESVDIPDDFLPPEAPHNAHSQSIDFTATDPRLPRYKNLFAAVIDDLFTESECKELIRLAEATTITTATFSGDSASATTTPTWERAMINVGNGKQVLATDTRNCGRIIWDSPLLAQRLLDRLMPFLRDFGMEKIENQPLVTGLAGRKNVYHLSRLNERLRFLKYEGGEYFRPHWDAFYVTPRKEEISYYTIHLYLNGDGEQDLEELTREKERVEEKGDGEKNVNGDPAGKLLGGATSFVPNFREEDRAVRIFPKTGSVLVFQQNNLLHGGDPVFRGTKYTMRTDVMYKKQAIS